MQSPTPEPAGTEAATVREDVPDAPAGRLSSSTVATPQRTRQQVTDTQPTIQTPRLDLVVLHAPALEALIAGDVATASGLVGVRLQADLGRRAQTLLSLRLRDLRTMPGAGRWLLRAVALRTPERPMIGLCGFHGPPDITGTVEVGYEIDSTRRRRGYASEAAAALTAWALTAGGASRVLASIHPDNEASLGVARRVGFRAAGSRWDAIDGTALLFERRTPPPVDLATATCEPPGPNRAKMPHRLVANAAADGHPEALAVTDDAKVGDIYPQRSADETRSIGERLRDVLRAHRADPEDPEHRCLCGYDGESYDDHLAWSTLRDMKDLGYEVRPVRY